MTKLQERLVNAYVVLIMAEKKTLEDAPEAIREYIQISIAEKEIEILG